MCFVSIPEQTAIISLYSINWLVCITETECLLRGTDWIFNYKTTNCVRYTKFHTALNICVRTEPVPSWSWSQAVSKRVWHIPLLCVQWKTPGDGQRNCPNHVGFYSKNKFERLVHLVGSITRMLYLCCEPGFRTVCCFPFWMPEGYPCLLTPEEFIRVVGLLCFCLVPFLLFSHLIWTGFVSRPPSPGKQEE